MSGCNDYTIEEFQTEERGFPHLTELENYAWENSQELKPNAIELTSPGDHPEYHQGRRNRPRNQTARARMAVGELRVAEIFH